jgi:hypothetical protein
VNKVIESLRTTCSGGEFEQSEEDDTFGRRAPPTATPPSTTEPEQAEESASGLSTKEAEKEVGHASHGAPPLDGEVLERLHEPRFADVWKFHPIGYEGAATKRWNDMTSEERTRFWLWLKLENMRTPLRRPLMNPTPLAVLLESPRWREESHEEVVAQLRDRWDRQNEHHATMEAQRRATEREAEHKHAKEEQRRQRKDEAWRRGEIDWLKRKFKDGRAQPSWRSSDPDTYDQAVAELKSEGFQFPSHDGVK